MPESAIDLTHFFLFIVPGAMTVWSYRHFTKSTKSGDFEYLALSAFWGTAILIIEGAISSTESLTKLLGNPYIATLALSIVGFSFGWIGYWIIKIKNEFFK